MTGAFDIRPMTTLDGPAVLAIYQEGMDTGNATFQATAPKWANFDAGHFSVPRLIAVTPGNDEVLGWAAASPISARPVYRGVAEESIYLAGRARGQGAGRALLSAFVDASEHVGLWTLQAGIFPENAASLALHKACGFEIIGTRRQIGQMGHGPFEGQWRDVIWLERRSATVGV